MGRLEIKSNDGKVSTPFDIALYMVNKLFRGSIPKSTSRILDAGCGTGVFIEAILAWCKQQEVEVPEIVGVEIDPHLVTIARKKFYKLNKIFILHGDFLTLNENELGGKFDYIVSNPPYISYEKINNLNRNTYKKIFKVAKGRFDIYMLFFEKALEVLKPGGRLVFITPEKFLYVISAKYLRKLLSQYTVEEIELINEKIFKGVLAYPTITVLCKKPSMKPTTIKLRNGTVTKIILPTDGSPWLAKVGDISYTQEVPKLKDIVVRISPGVATGRDEIFIVQKNKLTDELKSFAYPTISGSELSMFNPGEVIDYNKLRNAILVPYSLQNGKLLCEEEAKPLIEYLRKWKSKLESRYVVKKGKKWYAFHEDPPLKDILKPKILWRDITRKPAFYIDLKGVIIPRHTVYYLVPKNPDIIFKLAEYLNSDTVRKWLEIHCQRAANGYLRLQSHVLRELPIPEDLQTVEGLEKWLLRKQ